MVMKKGKKDKWKISEINVKVGLTINLGNYESARIDAGTSLMATDNISTDNDIEYIKAFETAYEIVSRQINTKMMKIKAGKAKQQKNKAK